MDIAVVKKTFRYLNVFFYNHLYQPFVFRNLFLKSGISMQDDSILIIGNNGKSFTIYSQLIWNLLQFRFSMRSGGSGAADHRCGRLSWWEGLAIFFPGPQLY